MNYVFIALSTIIAILQISDLSFVNPKLKPWSIFFICLLVCILSTIKEISDQFEKKYESDSGVLYSKPTNGITYPSLLIGKSKLVFKSGWDHSFFTNPKLQGMFEGTDLRIWIENNQLFLTTTINDSNGHPIARIKANEFSVNSDFRFQRNFDEHSIEVIENNDVVLQAEMKDSATIKLSGTFYKDTPTTYVAPVGDSTKMGKIHGYSFSELEDESGVVILYFSKKADKLLLKPIFKYPSDRHKGERVNSK